jgi:hypothetical protein
MRLGYVTLRSGRRDRFRPSHVHGVDSHAFERWLDRQAARNQEHGDVAAALMAIRFYSGDGNARCIAWSRDSRSPLTPASRTE